jgi:hypothetical protein
VLEALFTPFYAPNAMHADISAETSTETRKTQSFRDFDENCYFLLIEIFWSLKALSTPFHAAKSVHADLSVETSSATRKTQSFFAFDENFYFVLE